jgi:hypothetical protein
MAMAKVFHNSVPNCKVIHPDGRQIIFANGKCITTLKVDIDYLESLVAAGDQFVSVDPDCLEIDTEELTEAGRIKKLQNEAVEAYKAQVAAASALNSSSAQATGVLPMTSAQVVNAIESNGGGTPAESKSTDAGTSGVTGVTGVKVSLTPASAK